MSKKKTAQKAWNKIAFGIVFVISCFVAMYILIHFYEKALLVGGAAALLLISAFLFLNAVFSTQEKFVALQEDEQSFLNGTPGDFQLKIAKHMKEVEKNQKEMLDVLKKQSDRMESKLGDVQHEVYLFSEKQINQTKSIIKFNKENARQLAISERETLEYVMHELKEVIENKSFAKPADRSKGQEEKAIESLLMESVPFAESVAAEAEEAEASVPFAENVAVEAEEDEFELPDDLDLATLFDIPELSEEAFAGEETKEKAATVEPASDPNA